MDNVSIISIPDSETSATGAALNETFSPKKRPSMGTPAVTPKRQAMDQLNTTFSPDDKPTVDSNASKVLDGTFSPVKDEADVVAVKCETPVAVTTSKRISRTPKKMLPEVGSSQFDSPAPNPVPDIFVVPPSTDRMTLRRSGRTPSKKVEPVATRSSIRRSTRQQQTPLKTVPEKKRGRQSKKGKAAAEDDDQDDNMEGKETEPTDEAEIIPETPTPREIVKESPAKKLKMEETTEVIEEADLVPMIADDPVQIKSEKPEKELEDKSEVEGRSMLFETEQPTLVENTVSEDPEAALDVDEEEEEVVDQSFEKTFNEFQAPMFASDMLPKSIRKRSLSVADMNPPQPKRNFRVQFHSPGNMEKTITEIDESLYLNFTKSFAGSFSIPAANTSVTASATKATKQPLRRKRSLSNAETEVDKLATLQFLCAKTAVVEKEKEKEKKPTTATGGSATKKMPTPSPRKKMPNFAAIHNSIFQQMESLTDFKERKKERAQFLLGTPNSSSNAASRPNIVKPVGRGAIGKANSTAAALKKPTSNLMKPKNRVIGKKPTGATTGVKLTEKKLAAILQTTDFPAMGEPTVSAPIMAANDFTDDKKPEEEMVDDATPAQPEEVKENVVESKSSGIKAPRVYAANRKQPLNDSSTSMTGLKNRALPAKTKPMPSKTLPHFSTKPVVSAAEADTKPAVNAYKIVKGVRMNRRFELMMKHRNTKTTEKN